MRRTKKQRPNQNWMQIGDVAESVVVRLGRLLEQANREALEANELRKRKGDCAEARPRAPAPSAEVPTRGEPITKGGDEFGGADQPREEAGQRLGHPLGGNSGISNKRGSQRAHRRDGAGAPSPLAAQERDGGE